MPAVFENLADETMVFVAIPQEVDLVQNHPVDGGSKSRKK
jgi:hypothetical protein